MSSTAEKPRTRGTDVRATRNVTPRTFSGLVVPVTGHDDSAKSAGVEERCESNAPLSRSLRDVRRIRWGQ